MGDRWLTFDCYGTLVDWRHGMQTTFDLLFPGRGADLLDAYHRFEADVESEGPFRPYRAVLAETLRRAAELLTLDLADDDATALAATIPYWPRFADVGPSLSALRAGGWKLAILTNCDRDLNALTRRRLPVPFDAVVTAEDVGAYKPDLAHFRRFQATFGKDADAWIHVAQSYFHDIRPASELGIPRVWINRLQERIESPSLADATLSGLETLPDAVARLEERASRP
jgi:2-haloacid dehalogenase